MMREELRLFVLLVLAASCCSASVEWDVFSEDFKSQLEAGFEDGWREMFEEPSAERPQEDVIYGNVSEVIYYLWTRSHPDDPVILEPYDANNLAESTINFSLPTYLLYHGYDNFGLADYIIGMRDAFLTKEDCNVISVDYSKLVEAPHYVLAVHNVYKVAHSTAEYLDWMVEESELDLKKLHIIGHSLGGHNAGMTAKYLKSGKPARVTGLDPAGPLFYKQDTNFTISKESADFVDIIHSNGCFLLNGCFGMHRSLGHVDFYPNGGVHQAGCMNDTMEPTDDTDANCSHHRSTLFWIESILAEEPQDKTFHAWMCSSWESFDAGYCHTCDYGCQKMGFPATADYPGLFYLRTAEHSPYALGGVSSVTNRQSVLLIVILAAVTSLKSELM